MVLEVASTSGIPHYWALCSQLVPMSRSKLLLFSDATAETWTSVMDQVMKADGSETSVRLKWKASRNGGRTIATPSATATALAASRRLAGRAASHFDHLTDVMIKGEIGREDGAVMKLLMNHLAEATGLNLKETEYSRDPRPGEFVHLATKDASAPPGKMRLILSSAKDVRKVYSALHGQTVQVGQDLVGIEVGNDLVDGQGIPGNGLRSRA